MKIVEKDIKNMVLECLARVLLNEISMGDAYSRFYQDKITPENWAILTSGTKSMTPFHKKVADFMVSSKNPAYLAKMASKLWSMGRNAQQFLVNTAKEGYSVYSNENSLLSFLIDSINRNGKEGFNRFSENDFIDDGLVRIYEDDNLLVTCTLSYSASRKYYGDSHWCTASGVEGRYNGYRMFKNYTVASDSILLQFVNKSDKYNTFQIQATGYDDYPTICNFNDDERYIESVRRIFGEERTNSILKSIDYKNLIAKTKQYVDAEHHYYSFREERFYDKIKNIIFTKLNSKECQDFTLALLKRDAIDAGDSSGYNSLFYYWVGLEWENHFVICIDYEDYDNYSNDEDVTGDFAFTDEEKTYINKLSERNYVSTSRVMIVKVEGNNLTLLADYLSCRIDETFDKFAVLIHATGSDSDNTSIVVSAVDGKKIVDKELPRCYSTTGDRFVIGNDWIVLGVWSDDYKVFDAFLAINKLTLDCSDNIRGKYKERGYYFRRIEDE